MKFPGFEIDRTVGEPAGRVQLRGRRVSDGRKVLLELAAAEAEATVALFRRELEISRDLESQPVSGIVRALEVIEEGGSIALIREDPGGQPLDWEPLDGRPTLAMAFGVARQVAEALATLHHCGFIHRDLRPRHILVNLESGAATLTGLGRASRAPRQWQGFDPSNWSTRALAYISPEQTGRTHRLVDYRTDLYSLGVTFFEMLTGQLPFTADDPMGLIHAHIACPPPRPDELISGLPEVVCEIVLKLLAKTAEERYQGGLGLAHDLDQCRRRLDDRGKIRHFRLGERDIPARFKVPQSLLALENARLHHELRLTLTEVSQLKDRLEAEKVYLREEMEDVHDLEEIIGENPAWMKVLHRVEQVAATDATVVVLGETGTGKELIARAVHRWSRRRHRPLVKVNCATLPANLIESELFGHEKGAFTGAYQKKIGRFELADGGTLLLDEIAEIVPELQVKLLRILQEGEFERLGGTKTRRVDVRVIAATNRNLEKRISEGTFRADLYYRLTVFPVELPPLRDRQDDIPLFVHHFLRKKQGRLGGVPREVPPQVMQALVNHSWPGNVRELENIIERALIISPGKELTLDELFVSRDGDTESSDQLDDVEREHILGVLESCDWRVKGKDNAAQRLGLHPSTLRFRMKKLGIARPTYEAARE